MDATNDVAEFLRQHQLPNGYANNISLYFAPIAASIAELRTRLKRPILIGINGCQGSGKTTLADALVMLLRKHQLKALAISIDDFYLTKKERGQLAQTVHPLLATRGVPGTHDMALAKQVITALLAQQSTVAVPRFNKATDDRHQPSEWDNVDAPLDVIILEGWCVLAKPQPEHALSLPVNELEATEDAEGVWRRYVNQRLQSSYKTLYDTFDSTVMLRAPSFKTVYNWRLEQEEKLIQALTNTESDTSGIMSPQQVQHFIQHYQRITEYTLESLPDDVDWLLQLDEQRQILELKQRT